MSSPSALNLLQQKLEQTTNEVICHGVRQKQIVGIFLTVLSLLACAIALWLFSGFSTIPAFVAGSALTLGGIGTLAISISFLAHSFFK